MSSPTVLRSLQASHPSEYLAFVIWYAFLVLCCLLPTCIAYRRRRRMERRLVQQQAQIQQRLQASNMVFLRSMQRPDVLEAMRTRAVTQELEATTMTLEKKHFANAHPVMPNGEQAVEITDDETDDEENMVHVLLGDEEQARSAPGMCAICLSPFTEGETISWSSLPQCQHAFHTDCVVPWLAKQQQEAKCPVCRQVFCTMAEESTVQRDEEDDSFFRTFSQALLLSQLYGATQPNGRSFQEIMASVLPQPTDSLAMSFPPQTNNRETELVQSPATGDSNVVPTMDQTTNTSDSIPPTPHPDGGNDPRPI